MTTMINLTSKSQEALKTLLEIDHEASQELSDLLAANLEGVSDQSDSKELSKRSKKMTPLQAFKLLDFFVPFCMVHLSESTDYKDLVDSVLVSLSQPGNKISFTVVQRKQLKQQLSIVFSNPLLALKSKAVRLQTTHDKTYQKAEILSDIRPVFSVNGKSTIDAAVTFQTLRIEFFTDGELKSFSCAMDAKDIRLLKGVLERAEKKQEALSTMLDRAGISTFKVE